MNVPLRPLTCGPEHHFFGYYDKTPWDRSGRYVLALRVGFIDRPNTAEDVATIGMIDTAEENRFRPLDTITAWNWQQGAMLQWLGGADDREVIYNVFDGGNWRSVIRNVFTGETRSLAMPVYFVSRDGRTAVTLNFARVDDCRAGYGYRNLPDARASEAAPAEDGIWRMDLRTGECEQIVSLAGIAARGPYADEPAGKHWFNHLMLNPSGTRLMFLHRYFIDERRHNTRMYTCALDGGDLYLLNGPPMTSHYDWRDEEHILCFCNRKGSGEKEYVLFRDRSEEHEVIGRGVFPGDGHCSYSPDRRWILTDTYPDAERMRTLYLYRPEDGRQVVIGRFLSPQQSCDETRCDLHPRWDRTGRRVCIDSWHEGDRQMYELDVSEVIDG